MVTLIYSLLILVTIFIVIMSCRIAKKSSSLIPVFPIVAMYYWSLYGVWSWIPMKLRGESSFIEDTMFLVNIDGYYFLSVLYYSLFIVIFIIYEWSVVRRKSFQPMVSRKELSFFYLESIVKLSDNKLYNSFLVFLLFGFIFLWIKDLSNAFSSGTSAYQASRWESETGSMEYLSMFLGNLFNALIVPLLFVKGRNKKKFLYLILIGLYFTMNFLLGNRSALLCGLVLGVIVYAEIYGLKRIFNITNVLIGICLLFLIQFISIVRGLSINALISGEFTFNISDIFASLSGSSEKDAAQLSMYGTLKSDVPYTFGSSFLFLISTIIPSFMGIERPMRVYEHYVRYAIPHGVDMGVTIHHVTAWYINLGIIGIIIGALLWGYTLKFFFVRRRRFLYMYGAALFSAAAIPMIRDGGIECYKGCLILGTIIPMCIVWYCLKPSRKIIKIR